MKFFQLLRFWHYLLGSSLLISTHSYSCPEVRENNDEIGKNLAAKNFVLEQLNLEYEKKAITCKQENHKIATTNATSAKGESCQAQRELLAMNNTISEKTIGCADLFAEIKQGASTLVNILDQDQLVLNERVDLDKQRPMLQEICGAELVRTALLGSDTSIALGASRNTLDKAAIAESKYRGIGFKTNQMANTNFKLLEDCGLTVQEYKLLSPKKAGLLLSEHGAINGFKKNENTINEKLGDNISSLKIASIFGKKQNQSVIQSSEPYSRGNHNLSGSVAEKNKEFPAFDRRFSQSLLKSEEKLESIGKLEALFDIHSDGDTPGFSRNTDQKATSSPEDSSRSSNIDQPKDVTFQGEVPDSTIQSLFLRVHLRLRAIQLLQK